MNIVLYEMGGFCEEGSRSKQLAAKALSALLYMGVNPRHLSMCFARSDRVNAIAKLWCRHLLDGGDDQALAGARLVAPTTCRIAAAADEGLFLANWSGWPG